MMPPVVETLSSLSRISARLLISATLEASLLTLTLAFALRIFPGISAVIRFALWTTVLAASIVLPFVPELLPSAAAYSAVPTLHADVRWSFAIAAIWVVVSAVRATQLLLSLLRLRGVAQRSTPVAATGLFSVLSGNKGYRAAALCTSDDVIQPSVIGFFSPRILLPSGLYETLSPAELDQIVLHEMEHLRRRDDWINLLQKIVLAIFPLNPVLFWVERRLCLERELACDDSVLSATKSPVSYASCLVHLAENRIVGRQVVLALGAWGRRSELTRRVHHILEPNRKRMSRTQVALAVAIIGVGLAVPAALLSRSPQLVSFSAQPAPSATASAHDMPPQYREVSLRDSAAPQARLVNVVMPVRSSTQPAKAATPQPARRLRPSHRASTRTSEPTQRMLTSWAYPSRTLEVPVALDESDMPQLTYAVLRVQRTSYAAVATPDGWLIIQL